MRIRKQKAVRAFSLEAGDELVMHPHLGYLVLIKVSGEVIDLNQLIMDAGSTAACMTATTMLDPLTFLQLAAPLAVSYGMTCGSVTMTSFGFVAQVRTPHAHDFGPTEPSDRATKFMMDPKVPSLETVR